MRNAAAALTLLAAVLSSGAQRGATPPVADLILYGRVYALAWLQPSVDGSPATGVLAAGRWADITVLGIDPFTTPPDALRRGKPVMTIVAGKIVR